MVYDMPELEVSSHPKFSQDYILHHTLAYHDTRKIQLGAEVRPCRL